MLLQGDGKMRTEPRPSPGMCEAVHVLARVVPGASNTPAATRNGALVLLVYQ